MKKRGRTAAVEREAFNGLGPSDRREMQRRLREDEAFIGAQKRRARPEGRIGINDRKRGLSKNPEITCKSLKKRKCILSICWGVLLNALGAFVKDALSGKTFFRDIPEFAVAVIPGDLCSVTENGFVAGHLISRQTATSCCEDATSDFLAL